MQADIVIHDDDVLRELQQHVGNKAGIHVGDLVRRIVSSVFSSGHHERRVRDAIAHLRLAGHPICGQPHTGYFLAATPEELDATCAYLRRRAMTSLQIEARMRRLSMPELLGQLALAPESTTTSTSN